MTARAELAMLPGREKPKYSSKAYRSTANKMKAGALGELYVRRLESSRVILAKSV
jgi:hypothetical protein